MKFTLIVLLLCSLQVVSNAQAIQITDLGNGEHSFSSPYPDSHLHFYLFEDGYHSFESNPIHEFSSLETMPNVYTAGPYDDDIIITQGLTLGSSSPDPTIVHQEIENTIKLKRSWNLVQQKENFFVLMFENPSDYVWNGCIEFFYDSDELEITGSKIKDYHTDLDQKLWVKNREYSTITNNSNFDGKFSWIYTNLKPGEQRFIYIPAECNLSPFKKVLTKAVLFNGNCGDGGEYYDDNLNSIVSSYPHDPNAIVSHCDYLDDSQDENTIQYRLYFQNEGTGPAEDVFVDFFTNGSYNNIKLVDSSDKCNLTWQPSSSSSIQGTSVSPAAQIVFDQIYLPATNQSNPPASYRETIGWVDILVCYNNISKLQSLPQRCISTNIAIQFDNQPFIFADEKTCLLPWAPNNQIPCSLLSCPAKAPRVQYSRNGTRAGIRELQKIASTLDFSVFPNPSSGVLNIAGLQKGEEGTISILDIHNRVQRITSLDNTQIDISGLESGIYYIVAKNNIEVKAKQFVKI